MTNYNDGKWHGWNGGERPVHPESMVEWLHVSEVLERDFRDAPAILAGYFDDWSEIIAFRVVKEYREPRECWAYLTHMHDSLADAEAFRAQVDANHPGRGHLDTPITHWREVV